MASSRFESLTITGLSIGISMSGKSSKGSDKTKVCRILTFICGLLSLSQKESFIFLNISNPYSTFPKTVCFPFIDERSAFVRVIKNSLLFKSGPRLAVAR